MPSTEKTSLRIRLTNGEWRHVSRTGEITRINMNGTGGTHPGSPNWIFLGLSFHPWRNGVDVTREEIFSNPDCRMRRDRLGRMMRPIGWDRDHGTTRSWGSPSIAWIDVL